jgi:hypothetical protein
MEINLHSILDMLIDENIACKPFKSTHSLALGGVIHASSRFHIDVK